MALFVTDIPPDPEGSEACWDIVLSVHMTGSVPAAQFVAGRSVAPVPSRSMRRIVSAMGNDVRAVRRVSDGLVVGDASAFAAPELDASKPAEIEPGDIVDQAAYERAKSEGSVTELPADEQTLVFPASVGRRRRR